MAGKTSGKSAKVAKKSAAKRVVAKAAKPSKTAPKSRSRKVAKPALLAGGNPQIAKAYGDAPLQAHVAALDIHEDDQLDKTQLAGWVKQASQLPGERM